MWNEINHLLRKFLVFQKSESDSQICSQTGCSFSCCQKTYFTRKGFNLTPELAQLLIRDMRFSSEKAKRKLGYRIPPVKKSLQDWYGWLKEENMF